MDVFEEVKKLNFPADKYVVFAGAALAARGLKETRDIDIIVSQDLLEKMEREGWEIHPRIDSSEPHGLHKGDTELYPTIGAGVKITFKDLRKRADIINDIPFASLEDLIVIKQAYGREKDFRDIERIKEYLASK